MDAYRVHLIKSFAQDFVGALIWTSMSVYQVLVVGLTPLQLVLVGTVMETTIFFFEVPTGVVADTISRRLSCWIGYGLLSVAYLVQGLFPTFGALLFGNVIWGLGYTFTSGAYEAWMVDELGEARMGEAFVRGGQFGRAGGILGIALSAALGVIDLRLPIVLGAILLAMLTGFLIVTMKEPGFTPTASTERATWRRMLETFRGGVAVIRTRPALLNIVGVRGFFGLFSEGWDRLWQAHLIQTFTVGALAPAVVWVAGLNITSMLLGIIVSGIAARRLVLTDGRHLTRAMLGLTAAMVAAIFTFGLAPFLAIALAAFLVFVVARELYEPLEQTWTNQHIDPGVRATVLSMLSQTDAIGEMAGGPPIGAVGNRSLRAAFAVSGTLLAPALWFILRSARQGNAVKIEDVATVEKPVL